MGRAYSEPEVHETEYSFVIFRVMDPDDEFATKQVLVEDHDTGELSWGDYTMAYGPDVVQFWRKHHAERFLKGMLFGRDSVSVVNYL